MVKITVKELLERAKGQKGLKLKPKTVSDLDKLSEDIKQKLKSKWEMFE